MIPPRSEWIERVKAICLVALFSFAAFGSAADSLAAAECDSLRHQSCEGEACLAKYKAIQDCEDAINAEAQRRTRRRLLQRYRDLETKRKKGIDAQNDWGEPNR